MNINQLRSAKRFTPDKFFIGLTRILGIGLIVLIFGILITLLSYSWPSIHKFGLPFLWHGAWDPVSDNFGAGIIILGTLVTSAIGMVIAIPLSFGIAILITQVLPDRLGTWVARLVELMAGIPSIIYGMWGLFVLGPFLARHVQPFLIVHTQHIPILNFVFGGISIGIGIFTAGIILGIMVVPLISSVMRDVLASVPEVMKEAAYGVGMTRWEVVRNILVPYTRAGMLGGIILGFGRAIGETMAVTFVIGNSHALFTGLFMPGTTISATIANEFNEASGQLYPSALMELGLILFLITFITLAISRYFLKHSRYARGGSQ